MNSEEYNNRLNHALTGLEKHLGKDATRRFYERSMNDARTELEYLGIEDENALLEHALWKVERKLDLLIETEMM
jgi:hypothetical protein